MTKRLKLIAFLVIVVPLSTAFECAQITSPLTTLQDGFVDESLIGDWHRATISSDGLINVEELFASLTKNESGELTVVLHGGDHRQLGMDIKATFEFSGYSSRLDGDTYLNLRLVDIDCSTADDSYEDCEQERSVLEAYKAHCPYTVISYSQEIAAAIKDHSRWDDLERWRLANEIERLQGQLLAIGLLDYRLVTDSIKSDRVREVQDCDECKCIDVSSELLKEIIAEHKKDIFWTEDVPLFVRKDRETVYSKGYPIGATRSQIIRQLDLWRPRDVTLVKYGFSEIVTIGPGPGEEKEEIRRVFRLDGGRLVEIVDQQLNQATIVELVAHNIRRPTFISERDRFALPTWEVTRHPSGGFDIPLAECVEEVSRGKERIGGVPNELVAAGLLAQCMSDKHYYFSIWSGRGWEKPNEK